MKKMWRRRGRGDAEKHRVEPTHGCEHVRIHPRFETLVSKFAASCPVGNCPYIECEMLATLNINPLKCSGVRRLHFEVFGVIQV